MPRAFRPDPDGLSTVIPSPAALDKMNNDKWKNYGIYSIDASLLAHAPQPAQQRPKKQPVVRAVTAHQERDDEWGDDHVSIKGVTKGLHEWLRDIAVPVRPPGPLGDSVQSAM